MTEDLKEEVYQSCGRIVVRTIGSDTLLVPVSGASAGGRVFPVNDSALLVWERVAEGDSVQAATEALAARYQLDTEEAIADCRECIDTFLDEGLLEIKKL